MRQFVIFRKMKRASMQRTLSTGSDLVNVFMANGATGFLHILVLVIGLIIFFAGNEYKVKGIFALIKI